MFANALSQMLNDSRKMLCGGGGNNTYLKAFFRFFIILICAYIATSLAVADDLDERLQKLERQREALQAKIQKEAQIKEMKAQKKREAQEARELEQAKAKEMRAQKEALKAERKMQKEIQAQETKNQKAIQAQTKKAQKEARKHKPNIDFATSQETQTTLLESTTPNRTRRKYQNPSAYQYTNPNDRNGWFIAFSPKVDVLLLYSGASTTTSNYLFRFGADYGATLEAGYLFGSGVNRWRVYFGLGYGYSSIDGGDSDISSYYYSYMPESKVLDSNANNIIHSVGIDWIPPLGNSNARFVLGFSNSFSYMILSDTYDKYNKSFVCEPTDIWYGSYYGSCTIPQGQPSYTPVTQQQGYLRPIYNMAGQHTDLLHLFFIGIGTKLGVIFDIKKHFSLEIGSKINLNFSILSALNNQGLKFSSSVMPNFEQYLSLVYRF